MKRNLKLAAITLCTVLVASLAIFVGYPAYQKWQRTIVVGDLRIDPEAPIEPDTEYRLVLWENPSLLPGDTEAHEERIRQAVKDFESTWPNVFVDIHIVENGDAKLKEALAQGNPPDVYGSSSGAHLFSETLQIPVTPYLSPESMKDTTEAVLKAVSARGSIWAWPRWVLLHHWMASSYFLTADETREGFTDQMRRFRQDYAMPGVMLNPADGRLLADILVASTGKTLIDANGERAWTESEIIQGLNFIKAWIDENLTGRDPNIMSRTRLASFWNGDTAVVAPTSPLLMEHFVTRGTEMVGIPISPPSFRRNESPVHDAGIVGSFIVLTRDPYPGDGHTKMAMMLAEHLSRTVGPAEAAVLFTPPAHPSSFDRWKEATPKLHEHHDAMILRTRRLIAPPADERFFALNERALRDIVGPELIKLWEGESVETIASNMIGSFDGFRALARGL